MVVIIGSRTLRMNRIQYKKFLEMASGYVKKGIYAIEKDGIANMRNDNCSSTTQLKKLKYQYKQQGYKVHANG